MISRKLWPAGLILFFSLGVVDFVQTYLLITGSSGTVYEANPIADAWLERYGWGGLATFKLGALAVFTGAVILLAVRRPRAGLGIVFLGCLTHLAVTVYSGNLMTKSHTGQGEYVQVQAEPGPGLTRRVIPLPIVDSVNPNGIHEAPLFEVGGRIPWRPAE